MHMEKEDNYSAELDFSTAIPVAPDGFGPGSNPQFMDRPFSNFAEVLQFADFGPKLALHHHHDGEDADDDHGAMRYDDDYFPNQEINIIDSDEPAVQLEFMGASGRSLSQMMAAMNTATATSSDPAMNRNNSDRRNNNNGKRKRNRTAKTREEVESQRKTHIAVERNRRKQMNEHLRVLRSLMPTSYVQRGDQASIIGGAIEFVRELEQLLQCLESQKRRKLNREAVPLPLPISQAPFDPNNDQSVDVDDDVANLDTLMMTTNMGPGSGPASGLHEETAENKSTVADVEVKLLGFDALIKILSRRRPGQLLKALSAFQDLQFTILHTNITTIEQTALYSFNVKVSSETRFSAEDIASSVQQIFTFIHANSAV